MEIETEETVFDRSQVDRKEWREKHVETCHHPDSSMPKRKENEETYRDSEMSGRERKRGAEQRERMWLIELNNRREKRTCIQHIQNLQHLRQAQ